MTTDKTPATLATAKHGGCVQLGDWLPPLPDPMRMPPERDGTYRLGYDAEDMQDYARAAVEAALAARQQGLPRFRCSGYDTSDEASEENTGGPIMVADPNGEWVRASDALSAQPSPAGQRGDVARVDFTPYGMVEKPDGYYVSFTDHEKALAARQPVRIYGCCAQPEGELHTAECPNMRHLSARQPVGDCWSGWATQYPGALPKLYGAREIAEVNHHPDEGQRLIFLSERPAQAVDLSMLIAKIDQALGYLSTALDDLDSSPDRRPSVMVDEAMGCLRQALTGVPHG
ncbi:hypothetical protein [Stenotrophomonas geniculata]|uniref:hypothetical protein n=1 Tax=Stenotrophomonas geniculata TaxID=86188 RepID=UPI00247AFB3B|nr:hypothetical protein [Stenotrophomonas geniculata]MDH7548230.1 hypothetical protein [Stenotrophomonas geniculata]